METLGTVTILKHDLATIHSFQSPDVGTRVCSQVIETANKVVVVDALLLRPSAGALRRYVDRLGKPIERVIISHVHPDHWSGLEFFADVPIYALAETKGEIELYGEQYLGFKRAQFGTLIPDKVVAPTLEISEGTETIDGLRYVFTKATDAECAVALYIELPDLSTLVAQDLIYNNVYLFIGEKHFDHWISTLRALEAKGFTTVLAGHGEPSDGSVFSANIEYLESVKEIFATATDEFELKRRTMERFPSYRVPELLDISNVYIYHPSW